MTMSETGSQVVKRLPSNMGFVRLGFSNIFLQIISLIVLDQKWRGLTKVHNLPGRGSGMFTQLPVSSGELLCNYQGALHTFSSKAAAEGFINTLPNTDYIFTVSIMLLLVCCSHFLSIRCYRTLLLSPCSTSLPLQTSKYI